MTFDHNFLVDALSVIGTGGLQQFGRLGVENGLKAIKPYADGIWAVMQGKSKPKMITELETNPAMQTLGAELVRLIEAHPELVAELKQAIAVHKNTYVTTENIGAVVIGGSVKIDKQINANQSGKHNTQTNTFNLCQRRCVI